MKTERPPSTVTDPVCGMEIDPGDAVGTATHRGTTYFFCSRSCEERFTSDPERCTGAPKASMSPPPAAMKIEYTCPMHPEIVRDGPGACPICGMALEPRTLGVEDAENPELVDMRRRFWWVCSLKASGCTASSKPTSTPPS